MKTEYKRAGLGAGIRGKYYESYQASHNIVLLQPEVAEFWAASFNKGNQLGHTSAVIADVSSHVKNRPLHFE